MLRKNEEVAQFIRDLRSTSYYNKKIIECNLKLEGLANRMCGVGSPSYSLAKCENTAKNTNVIALMEEEDELLNERQKYIDRVLECDDIIMQITDDTERCLIMDLYIIQMRYKDLEKKYSYSRSTIFKKARSIISTLM